MLDENLILRRIDETCIDLEIDDLPDGKLIPLNISGVRGRISDTNSPMINVVGLADIPVEKCQKTISAVIERYKRENKLFGWVVGPTTKPANLGKYLEKEGFRRIDELSMSGMLLNDISVSKDVNGNFPIEEVDIEEFGKNVSLVMESFGMGITEDVARLVMSLYVASGDNSRVYFAYDPDSMKPVAFGASVMDSKNHLVILLGAGTLPEYRGRGIYSSLVYRRLNDARIAGARSAIIQAVKLTSAPICEKIGFRPVCDIDFYMLSS